jgi:hypothetical protein
MVKYNYRCDRCQSLAESYQELGYCVIGCGDVIDANIEYARHFSGVDLKWVRNSSGILNPRKCTNYDYAVARMLRIFRSIYCFMRYRWMFFIRWKIVWPIEARILKWRKMDVRPASVRFLGVQLSGSAQDHRRRTNKA